MDLKRAIAAKLAETLTLPRYKAASLTLADLVDWQKHVETLVDKPHDGGKEDVTTFFLAAFVELGELVNKMNWKPWKKPFELDIETTADEWGDVLAFLLIVTNLVAMNTGLTPQQLVHYYLHNTSMKNVKRFLGDVEGY